MGRSKNEVGPLESKKRRRIRGRIERREKRIIRREKKNNLEREKDNLER